MTSPAPLPPGPRTAVLSRASSRDSVRQSLYASLDAFRPEDKLRLEQILDHFSTEFTHPDPQSQVHLHELALAWFRRDRVRAMLEALLDAQIQLARKDHPAETGALSHDRILAAVFMGDARNKCLLGKLHRWDRAYSRDFDRALKALRDLPPPAEQEIAKTNPIAVPIPIQSAPPSLNGPCPCGSGLKYKRCCRSTRRHIPHPGPNPHPAPERLLS